MPPPVALSIAGSDSGGGAGIQADLKAMSRVGVHGTTAITSLTAQNSTGVNGIDPVDSEFVRNQVRTVTGDFDVRATKTGMLFSEGIISVVVEERDQLGQLVVDPVMVAESGDSLLQPEAEQRMIDGLIPEATIVTPNWPEAQTIAEHLDITIDGVRDTGQRLADYYDGPYFLMKGGHVESDKATDYLIAPGGENSPFEGKWFESDHTHGSGCAYSSLIAGLLARNQGITSAVQNAKQILTESIRNGYSVGEGAGTLNLLHTYPT